MFTWLSFHSTMRGHITNSVEMISYISDFKKGYQPRTNKVRNYFSQLLNVHGVTDVR
jgi:hypothetical protein